MPDWRGEIRRRLVGLNLPPGREIDVVEELAAHLTDRYEDLLSRGLSADAAEAAVIAEHLAESALIDALAGLGKGIAPERICLLGIRDIDPGERRLIADLGIWMLTMEE